MQQQNTSLKTELIVLGILLIISALIFAWAYDHFDGIDPVVVTEKTKRDPDDPAIWIHPTDPSKSLVLGTDKGTYDDRPNGRLYVFDLSGKIVKSKTVKGLRRPNNVDVEYGLTLGNGQIDIAVLTERFANRLRVYRLPDLTPIDGGGIPVFANEPEGQREPMGIGLYKRPRDGAIFAIVSRKRGASGRYLWQYWLQHNGAGQVTAVKVREFGQFYDHESEIEAIAVDDELGYVYYSDEYFGVRKYHADPDHPDAHRELGTFATGQFREDREGIAIYKADAATGYIIVSDQQANLFHIYTREGEPGNPHNHRLLKKIRLSTQSSDGCEATSAGLSPLFANGLFVAMSDDRTFHFYRWEDIAQGILEVASPGYQ